MTEFRACECFRCDSDVGSPSNSQQIRTCYGPISHGVPLAPSRPMANYSLPTLVVSALGILLTFGCEDTSSNVAAFLTLGA